LGLVFFGSRVYTYQPVERSWEIDLKFFWAKVCNINSITHKKRLPAQGKRFAKLIDCFGIMKLNIPVYKWNFLLFLKSKSPYPPTPQVAYLIDAIWQPKLNGVRGGWSVELRLEKVATSAHMHIQWDWEKNNRAQIVGWKPYPATFVLDTLWMACRISFETKPFSSIFFQGLDLKKEKNTNYLLLPALSSILVL